MQPLAKNINSSHLELLNIDSPAPQLGDLPGEILTILFQESLHAFFLIDKKFNAIATRFKQLNLNENSYRKITVLFLKFIDHVGKYRTAQSIIAPLIWMGTERFGKNFEEACTLITKQKNSWKENFKCDVKHIIIISLLKKIEQLLSESLFEEAEKMHVFTLKIYDIVQDYAKNKLFNYSIANDLMETSLYLLNREWDNLDSPTKNEFFQLTCQYNCIRVFESFFLERIGEISLSKYSYSELVVQMIYKVDNFSIARALLQASCLENMFNYDRLLLETYKIGKKDFFYWLLDCQSEKITVLDVDFFRENYTYQHEALVYLFQKIPSEKFSIRKDYIKNLHFYLLHKIEKACTLIIDQIIKDNVTFTGDSLVDLIKYGEISLLEIVFKSLKDQNIGLHFSIFEVGVKTGNCRIVQLLLEFAAPSTSCIRPESLLMAIEQNNLELVKLLMAYGKFNQSLENSCFLRKAYEKKNMAMIKLFLEDPKAYLNVENYALYEYFITTLEYENVEYLATHQQVDLAKLSEKAFRIYLENQQYPLLIRLLNAPYFNFPAALKEYPLFEKNYNLSWIEESAHLMKFMDGYLPLYGENIQVDQIFSLTQLDFSTQYNVLKSSMDKMSVDQLKVYLADERVNLDEDILFSEFLDSVGIPATKDKLLLLLKDPRIGFDTKVQGIIAKKMPSQEFYDLKIELQAFDTEILETLLKNKKVLKSYLNDYHEIFNLPFILEWAVINNHEELVLKLLKVFPEFNNSESYEKILKWSCFYGHKKLFWYFFAKKPIDALNPKLFSEILLQFIRKGDHKSIKKIFKCKSLPFIHDLNLFLFEAAKHHSLRLVKFFHKKGADPEVNHCEAYRIACFEGRHDILLYFLKYIKLDFTLAKLLDTFLARCSYTISRKFQLA